MKVWIVSEGDCACCMYAIAAFSSEEKAKAYTTECAFVDIDELIVDEED